MKNRLKYGVILAALLSAGSAGAGAADVDGTEAVVVGSEVEGRTELGDQGQQLRQWLAGLQPIMTAEEYASMEVTHSNAVEKIALVDIGDLEDDQILKLLTSTPEISEVLGQLRDKHGHPCQAVAEALCKKLKWKRVCRVVAMCAEVQWNVDTGQKGV